MKLSSKQSGVVRGMALGGVVSLILVLGGRYFMPVRVLEPGVTGVRLSMLGKALVLPTLVLIVAIGRLARHRFITPDDIDGGGLSAGTDHARVLQSLLQNTLEQFCIALGAYSVWCLLMPVSTLNVPWICSAAFIVGRGMFFINYESGAPARAFGFALTFYPTVLMMLIIVLNLFFLDLAGEIRS